MQGKKTYQEAMEIVQKRFPNSVVSSVSDYDSNYFLVIMGSKKLTDMNTSSPYYLVDKVDGSIKHLNPIENFNAMRDAMANRRLYTRQLNPKELI